MNSRTCCRSRPANLLLDLLVDQLDVRLAAGHAVALEFFRWRELAQRLVCCLARLGSGLDGRHPRLDELAVIDKSLPVRDWAVARDHRVDVLDAGNRFSEGA